MIVIEGEARFQGDVQRSIEVQRTRHLNSAIKVRRAPAQGDVNRPIIRRQCKIAVDQHEPPRSRIDGPIVGGEVDHKQGTPLRGKGSVIGHVRTYDLQCPSIVARDNSSQGEGQGS